jgi:hypothetical protein
MAHDLNTLDQCQRVEVTRESQSGEQVVRISLERHDATLGWYTAGSLCIPLCQLPLMEQALSDLSASVSSQCMNCSEAVCGRKIIPFPAMAPIDVEEPIADAN